MSPDSHNIHDDDDDADDDVPAAAAVDLRPDQIAASIALRRAIPRNVIARFRRGAPASILLVLPSGRWGTSILGAAMRLFGEGHELACEYTRPRSGIPIVRRLYAMRDGTERANGRPDLSGTFVPAYVGGHRGSTVGIAADISLLPPEIVAAADRTFRIQPLSAADLRRVVRQVTRSKKVPGIPENLASGLSPADIALAVRAYATPGDALRRLQNLADSRILPADSAVPRLEDLAGYGEAADWGLALVRDLQDYRRNPSAAARKPLTRSVLLAGPPGVGKTLFASALAKSAGVPLVVSGYADWQTFGGGYLNDVMNAMRKTFDDARDAANRSNEISILVLDELDSLPSRNSLVGGRNDSWWTTVVNAFLTLTELSSPARAGVVLVGATNHAARIDAALLRSGRFDRTIDLRLPGRDDLARIVRTHLGADLPGADLGPVAALAPPSSGADAARWVRDARAAARRRGTPLALTDLVAQIAPPETRSLAHLRNVALHEAAHAVLSFGLMEDRLVSVSLVESGFSSGHTEYESVAKLPETRKTLEDRVVVRLAGRAADAHFGEADAGAGGSEISDLAAATRILAAIHLSFGLGRTLVHFGAPDRVAEQLQVDLALRRQIEADLARLYARAQALVAEKSAAIEAVATALVARRVLSGDEVARIVRPARSPARRVSTAE